MNPRNPNESRNRLATGIRVATIVAVAGTIAAVWHPMHSSDSNAAQPSAATVTTAPDMSVYFPDRFPVPQGSIEELPPQF
jgi:hypothetical protein